MKTVVLMGLDNAVFTAADLINPNELKLVGFATPIEEAWNIYNEQGDIVESIDELPIMPIDAVGGLEPDCIILVSSSKDEEESLKYSVYRIDYRGEVLSLHDFFEIFSLKTASIRKTVWRQNELGINGAVADLGHCRGDIAWQLNALMPERKLYIFETFMIDDLELEKKLLSRMPYHEMVSIKTGSFPDSVMEFEEDNYALVHIDTGNYQSTYKGIQYFFARLSKGGVIYVTGYEDGKNTEVRKAIDDLEKEYGAFLITQLCDLQGTIIITRP